MQEVDEASTPPRSGWSPKLSAATTLVRCARHRETDALFHCDKCRMKWCALCVRTGSERSVTWALCACHGRCSPIVASTAGRPLTNDFGECFTYPFRGEGRLLLLLGAAVYGLVDLYYGNGVRAALTMIAASAGANVEGGGSGNPIVTGVGMVIVLILFGYLLSWVARTIRESARGRDVLPPYPEFIAFYESIVKPVLRMTALLFACFLPGMLVLPFGAVGGLLGLLLLAGGAFVLPMALTSVAIADSIEGLDPLRIVRSIGRVGVPYAFASALFFAVLGLLFIGTASVDALGWLAPFVRSFLSLYLAAVAGRVLGRVYARHEKELGWY